MVENKTKQIARDREKLVAKFNGEIYEQCKKRSCISRISTQFRSTLQLPHTIECTHIQALHAHIHRRIYLLHQLQVQSQLLEALAAHDIRSSHSILFAPLLSMPERKNPVCNQHMHPLRRAS